MRSSSAGLGPAGSWLRGPWSCCCETQDSSIQHSDSGHMALVEFWGLPLEWRGISLFTDIELIFSLVLIFSVQEVYIHTYSFEIMF